jgi:hypothetical protein
LFIQKGVFGIYTLSSSLIIYIFGSMQSSAVKSSMYPIWAISLGILYGSADSVTAYTLSDNKLSLSHVCQAALFYAYVFMLLLKVSSSDGGLDVNISIEDRQLKGLFVLPVVLLLFIALLKSLHRAVVCMLARHPWNLNRMVADYMYDEHTKGEFVPSTMEGCHYLVDWPLRKSRFDAPSYATRLTAEEDEIIDIEKIWKCDDSSLGLELKYTCLSFSLFHLLNRRCFGFACGESRNRAHDFVFKGLLSDNVTDYNRVFKVIEVELAFMYDFHFTKYPVIYYGSRAATFWSLASFTCISLTACGVASRVLVIRCDEDESLVVNNTTEIVITLSVLACAALLELVQMLLYWTAIWARVSFVCQYLKQQAMSNTKGSCCMMRFKELLTKIGVYCMSDKHYWQHKLGQYSFLESVCCNPNPSKKEHTVINKLWNFMVSVFRFCTLFDGAPLCQTSDDASTVCMAPDKPIELSAEVKVAIVCSLKRTDGKLTNGKSSLVSNRAQDLLWACGHDMYSDKICSQKKENQAHLIMTWHIATCYCEMATAKINPCQNEGTEFKFHLDIAAKVSKYCAFLVVSAPQLLPGHQNDTVCLRNAVAQEATKFLRSSRDKYEAISNLAESEETIFQKGAKLGKQLEEIYLKKEIQDVTQCWKVLADFWAEMLLYLAPSDKAKAHVAQLAEGGEFITHLWALLSHAGILEREEHEVGGV